MKLPHYQCRLVVQNSKHQGLLHLHYLPLLRLHYRQ
jgi:hypothetical protein